jgi:hypothetical protein
VRNGEMLHRIVPEPIDVEHIRDFSRRAVLQIKDEPEGARTDAAAQMEAA